MIPITIEGHTYNSISAAWRELSPAGLPMITVRKRIMAGWNPPDAFKTEAVPATMRRTFPEVRA